MGITTVEPGGIAAAVDAVRYMRANDCDFLTVANVQDYGHVSADVARAALRAEMGAEWYQAAMLAELSAAGWDVIAGQRYVQIPDGRQFAVVRTGRRWTRVHEYLSNGQLTARWFVDEASGEAREADGWRKAKAWPMGAAAQEFARWVVMLATMD